MKEGTTCGDEEHVRGAALHAARPIASSCTMDRLAAAGMTLHYRYTDSTGRSEYSPSSPTHRSSTVTSAFAHPMSPLLQPPAKWTQIGEAIGSDLQSPTVDTANVSNTDFALKRRWERSLMHPGTPTSVPFPLLVYAVGSRVGAEYRPLPASTVTMRRSVAEADLAESDNQHPILIEQRVLPWAPARDTEYLRSNFEYTVGYSEGDRYTTLGLSFSTDRSAAEAELASVQAAIAEYKSDVPVAVLMLERPVLPWYPARPRATKLHR